MYAVHMCDGITHTQVQTGMFVGSFWGTTLGVAIAWGVRTTSIMVAGPIIIGMAAIGIAVGMKHYGGEESRVVTGALISGFPGVKIDGMPGVRAGLDQGACTMDNVVGPVATGSMSVLIGGSMAVRSDDMLVCGAKVGVPGHGGVRIAGPTGQIPGLAVELEVPVWFENTINTINLAALTAGFMTSLALLPPLRALGTFVFGLVGGTVGGESFGDLGHRWFGPGGGVLFELIGMMIGGESFGRTGGHLAEIVRSSYARPPAPETITRGPGIGSPSERYPIAPPLPIDPTSVTPQGTKIADDMMSITTTRSRDSTFRAWVEHDVRVIAETPEGRTQLERIIRSGRRVEWRDPNHPDFQGQRLADGTVAENWRMDADNGGGALARATDWQGALHQWEIDPENGMMINRNGDAVRFTQPGRGADGELGSDTIIVLHPGEADHDSLSPSDVWSFHEIGHAADMASGEYSDLRFREPSPEDPEGLSFLSTPNPGYDSNQTDGPRNSPWERNSLGEWMSSMNSTFGGPLPVGEAVNVPRENVYRDQRGLPLRTESYGNPIPYQLRPVYQPQPVLPDD